MTDGSLKLIETARISRSYSLMTSTFPWQRSVMAFCQWTILRGSYDAFSSSVWSIVQSDRGSPEEILPERPPGCQDFRAANSLKTRTLAALCAPAGCADRS